MGNIQRYEREGARMLRWGPTGVERAYDPDDTDSITKALRGAVAEGLAHGDVGKMSDWEREVAIDVQGRVGITKDASDALMIAWYPDAETAKTIAALYPNGGVAPEDLHLTLLYLGDPDADDSGPWDVELVAAVTKIFSRSWSPAEGRIGGIGRFVGDGDTDVIVALVDVPALGDLRDYLRERLYCEGAIPSDAYGLDKTHGYVPHITLAYVPKGQSSSMPALDDTVPIKVDNVTVAQGARRATYSLGFFSEGRLGDGDQETAALPYYASRFTAEAAGVEKAGKVLSAKNLEALQEAHAATGKILERATALASNEAIADEDPDVEPLLFVKAVTKADKRYTLGPLYAPNRKDAHGEWVTEDELQGAMWAFIQERFDKNGPDSNSLNIQHGDLGDISVGKIVEFMTWPQEVEMELMQADGSVQKHTFPAGTAWLGALWTEDAWPLVKSGKIGGLSMGGRAVRVTEGSLDSLEHMGWKHASRSKMGTHNYVDDGGVCKVCSATEQAGNHDGEEGK